MQHCLLTTKEELALSSQREGEAAVSRRSFILVYFDAQAVVFGGHLHWVPLTVIQTWAFKQQESWPSLVFVFLNYIFYNDIRTEILQY